MKKGTCRHFNGVQNETCKVGVRYDDFAGPGLPCIIEYSRSDLATCDRYEEPTVAEMSELPQRLRELAGAIGNCEWELPLCASEDCVRAADEIERLMRLSDELEATVGDTLHRLLWVELEERFRTSKSPLHQRLSMVLHVMDAVCRHPN